MADNLVLNAGVGGATLATDDVGGVHYQLIQPVFGALDAAKTLVTASAGLPVAQQGTWTVQPGNTANTTAWKVDGSAVTQPVSGTFWQATQPVSGTVASTLSASTNAGAAAKTSDFDSGAGTDTVTVFGLAVPASGGAAIVPGDATNGLKVQVATMPTTTVTATNLSTNVAQLAGTTTDTGSGAKSAGTLRVVLATDQPALTNKLLVTPDSVALPANQSVNVSQINAVTPLMGNGVTGTGSQRVTIASDNTAFSVNAVQSGTWTVQPGNTANTTAWKVDASSVAVPVTDNAGSLTVDNPTISVVGGGVEATAQRVTIASDSTGVLSVDDNGASLTVDGTVTTVATKSATATASNVAASATVVTVLAANASRLGATVFNDSTAVLTLHLGAAASATNLTTKLNPNDYYEVPYAHTGILTGLWASATGSARVVELT